MSLNIFRKRENEQGFLSIGKDVIDREKFMPIENTGKIKPCGGLWATKHEESRVCFNEWLDYLTTKKHILFYKYKDYTIPAVYFTLKEDAKILIIDSKNVIDYIKITCPGFDGEIDYSLLSSEFDGIFVDVGMLSKDKSLSEYVEQFSVNTLVLFNLDCIKEYQQAMVYIDIDDRYNYELIEYNIITEKKKYQVDEGPTTRKRR